MMSVCRMIMGLVPSMLVAVVGGLVWLRVFVGAMLLGGPVAFAARGHVFGGTFGEPCSGEPCGKGQFKEPGQVAVNEASGDVYVIDRGDDRVEWFSSSGTYLGQFDGSGSFEVGGKTETGTAAGGGGQPGEIATGKFTRPNSIAVDNACALHSPMLTEATSPTCHEFDPSAGDVYLLDAGGHEAFSTRRGGPRNMVVLAIHEHAWEENNHVA
jgi:hypothetical protein